jgi:TolB-like protein
MRNHEASSPTKLTLTMVCSVFLLSGVFGTSPVVTQQLQHQGTKELATQIAQKAQAAKKRRVAVVPFRELVGAATSLGPFLAEELTTHLFDAGGLQIVERTLLDKVFNELKLDATGAIEPDTAKQVGRLLGADALVTGTITDLTSVVAINCRLIDTQTGEVFSAAQTRLVKDDDIRRLMGVPLAKSGDRPVPSSQQRTLGPGVVLSQPPDPSPKRGQPPGTKSIRLGAEEAFLGGAVSVAYLGADGTGRQPVLGIAIGQTRVQQSPRSSGAPIVLGRYAIHVIEVEFDGSSVDVLVEQWR